MPKFCRKDAVVEAEQVTHRNIYRLAKRYGGRHLRFGGQEYIVLSTDEGLEKVNIGDWILKERKGRVYICPPDLFEREYQPVAAHCTCRSAVVVGITDTLVDQLADRVAERLAAELQKAVTSP
ncbi:hypothetical protein [Symbiobacterium thermophilum]|uniref:Uncharacterized protein n=1 Tax=Symbiobacterium thermophilum TaxID=2734 RepID=A0A953LGB4_SYMTR|nr:hypothetical protein [Symbiobacterium thermophilum]MBY6278480.1 hypothetical protein [Symbiobacterium thermophilum]